jgi:hypothetical protein
MIYSTFPVNSLIKYLIAAACVFTLYGCCCPDGASPEYITYFLNQEYDGRPVSQFFAQYGYPSGAFEKIDSYKVYIWASTQYTTEPWRATPTDFVSSRGKYQMVDTYHGFTARQYCEIRIYTNESDLIKNFSVAVDSTGKWSASRCSEIFD